MKTLRRIMVIGLLIGAYHSGIAQSNESPEFNSDTEKAAWIEANTKAYSAEDKHAKIESDPAAYQVRKDVKVPTRTVKIVGHSKTAEQVAAEKESDTAKEAAATK